MQTFIEAEVLSGLKKGSLESFSESVADVASKELGEEVSVFATHKEHAFGVAGDRVVKVTWKQTEDGTKFSVKDAKVSVITEKNVDTFAAKKLSEAVSSVMGDDAEDSRNRLRVLASHLLPGGRYWVSDGEKLAESVLGEAPPWLIQYRENTKAVRKTVHGVLGETEKQVPKTPYSKIPLERLEEFEPELRESLTKMSVLLGLLPDQMKGLKFDESDESEGFDLFPARDAIVSESTILEEAVGIVLKFLRSEDLPAAAKVHDILAERLKPMLVVGRFLSRMSDSQQSGEDRDASSS